jgi:hypothetical protein
MFSVAARHTMDDLQDNRAAYAKEVSEVGGHEAKNGLMLESMSLHPDRPDAVPCARRDANALGCGDGRDRRREQERRCD